jgi:hypothetical protein
VIYRWIDVSAYVKFTGRLTTTKSLRNFRGEKHLSADYHQQYLASHAQAGCIAAIYSCGAKPKEALGSEGAFM